MENKLIKVLIVDDSQVACELLKHILESDPDIIVVGVCNNGIEALSWLSTNTADVITMDVIMPKFNGFEVTRKIMETNPVPIVIVTCTYNENNTIQSFRSMEAGALAILEKPAGPGDPHFHEKSSLIIQTIKTVKEIKLVKRTLNSKIARTITISDNNKVHGVEDIDAVAIGASLGGPAALMLILSQLNPLFPVPIFIVQHIVTGFTSGLVRWLQEFSDLNILQAQEGEVAKAGHCYIAPDYFHMEIQKGNIIRLVESKKEGIQPSVSRLFKSMAEAYGKRSVGVILTGMGKDGAKELLLMKEKGAYTIAQDEKTCVMFGMPAEAINLGAVRKVLPLEQIPIFLNDLLMKKRVSV